jgi:hypothetical protein
MDGSAISSVHPHEPTPPWARTDASREGRAGINQVAASGAGLSRQREPSAD